MATRHRIPTIFNLSMVDVLCCALGCVILLWLLNLREAKQRTEAAGQTATLLATTRSRLQETDDQLQQTAEARDRLASRVADAEQERDELRKRVTAAQARASDLDKSLTVLRTQQAETRDMLAKKTKVQASLTKELAAAQQRLTDLDTLVRQKEDMLKTSARAAADLTERLHDADARLLQLRAQADLVPGLRERVTRAEMAKQTLEKDSQARAKDLAEAGDNLRDLERKVRSLTSQLADTNRDLASSQADRRSLSDQVRRARVEAENRFAGIALTGKRVVFLVDMSGSMELVDENTAAPDKWVAVRETLAKVMKSLPDLQQFQVVLFSTQASYLLGHEGQWIDFDPVTSTPQVAKALAAVKPKGNTDMYAAFQEAFRFRPRGLDTIYLFSDGLPNIGAGLSPERARYLKETERSEILSKYVRQTLLTQWNPTGARAQRVRINALGFFYESPDVGAFLWALARENDGSFVGMSRP